MKCPVVFAGAAALALSVASSAFAAEVKLVGVTCPEGTKLSVPFTRTAIAPKAATLEGTLRMEKGQVDIKLSWKMMEPAVMFAGAITAYNVWAVTSDGRPENLGELQVREKKSAQGSFRTGKVSFAIMVTVDVLPGTVIPSELVLFTSGKVDPAKAKSADFSIETKSMIGELTRPGNPSIADLTYEAKGMEPIELVQADEAYDIAVELKAETVAPKEMETAKTQLAQARNAVNGGSKTIVADFSRRALDSAGTAVRMKVQEILDQRLAAEEAKLEAAEEKKRQELEAAKAQTAAAEAEKARMAAEVTRMKAEQEQLKASIRDAVGKYMQVEESARGLVINMADIAFDVNESTLKEDPELALAKVSAILGVFPKVQVRAEGFTDTTGKEELNMKLSAERARTVAAFLVAQGVPADRLTHAGYGPANPVGDDATAEGRAKNRRVELILNQGPVSATPGGMVAPEPPAKAKKPAAKPAAK